MTESEKKWKSAEAEGKWLGICLFFLKTFSNPPTTLSPKSVHTLITQQEVTAPMCRRLQHFSVPVLFYVHIGAVGAQESLASSFSLSFLPKRCKYNTEENT